METFQLDPLLAPLSRELVIGFILYGGVKVDAEDVDEVGSPEERHWLEYEAAANASPIGV